MKLVLLAAILIKPQVLLPSSGKNNFALFSQNNFAWLLDDQEEQKFIKVMKKATDLIIVKARTN